MFKIENTSKHPKKTVNDYPANRIVIHQANLVANYSHLRNLLSHKTRMIAMVKSNAYGHGLIPIVRKLTSLGVDALGVFTPEEGIAIRESQIHQDILIFGPLLHHQIPLLIYYRLIPVIGSHTEIHDFINHPSQNLIPIQIKIDTGMGRIGFFLEELPALFDQIQKEAPHLQITGICTHYADAGNQNSYYTEKQTSIFEKAIQLSQPFLSENAWIHTCNSDGLLRYPAFHFSAVRPGLLLYGISPLPHEQPNWNPVLSLHSYLNAIKILPKDAYVSYTCSYKTTKETRIGIIPIGYADGIPLSLSNNGWVLCEDTLCPMIGNVCMNQFMIDISHLKNPKVGERITIIGKQKEQEIQITQVASWAGTIPYEIMCCLSESLPRYVVD